MWYRYRAHDVQPIKNWAATTCMSKTVFTDFFWGYIQTIYTANWLDNKYTGLHRTQFSPYFLCI